MRTIRTRIVNYMRGGKSFSAIELARVFRLTPSNIRHHLSILEDEGAVVMVDTLIHGRGRPVQLYRLTCDVLMNNVQPLASALLGEWFSLMTDSEKGIALNKIVAHLLKKSEIKRGTLTQKLNQTVQFLNQMNYRVRWEAHFNAPLIIITHCPYMSMAKDFPVLCKMDAILLEKLLGQSVSQDIQTTEINQPEVQCMFRV